MPEIEYCVIAEYTSGEMSEPQALEVEYDEDSNLEESDSTKIDTVLETLIISSIKKNVSGNRNTNCKLYEVLDTELYSNLLNTDDLVCFTETAKEVIDNFEAIASSNSTIAVCKVLTPTVSGIDEESIFVFCINSTSAYGITDRVDLEEHAVLDMRIQRMLQYPVYGPSGREEKAKIFDNSRDNLADMDENLVEMLDNETKKEAILQEELQAVDSGRYDKYFNVPDEDRNGKRRVLTKLDSIVEPEDKMTLESAGKLANKYQMRCVDAANIDETALILDDKTKIKFRTDEIDKNVHFASNGQETLIIMRASSVEINGIYNPLDFVALEDVETLLSRLKIGDSND